MFLKLCDNHIQADDSSQIVEMPLFYNRFGNRSSKNFGANFLSAIRKYGLRFGIYFPSKRKTLDGLFLDAVRFCLVLPNGRLRFAGYKRVSKAVRYFAAHPQQALSLLNGKNKN